MDYEADGSIIVNCNEILVETRKLRKIERECDEIVKQFENGEIDEYDYFDSIQILYDNAELLKSNISCYVGEDKETQKILNKLRENCVSVSDKIEGLQEFLHA